MREDFTMPSTMNTTTDTAALKKLTSKLINDALAEIHSERPKSSAANEKHFLTAEYFLSEARDYYVDPAWDMLAIGNVRASLAISRWTLEAAMNLLWVVSDEDKVEQRLIELAREALRQDANLHDGLAGLRSDQAPALKERAGKARQVRSDLGCAKDFPDLAARMKDIKPRDRADWPKHYVLYRICCSAAHPGLKLHERFSAVGQATVSSPCSNNTILTPYIAAFLAAASPLDLVSSCYVLTHTGDLEDLKGWWTTKVVPLLG
jgi:hypothetical protein